MDLYFDGEKFIYTDYKAKFIVHPNYEMKIKGKKTKKVNLVTAGKVTDPKEFKMKKIQKNMKRKIIENGRIELLNISEYAAFTIHHGSILYDFSES